MSKGRLPNGRDKKEARHVRLYHWVLNTEAWKAATVVERCLYLALLTRFTGSNNGTISLSVREAAEELKVGKSSVQRGLKGLREKGFIAKAQPGNFSWNIRHSSTWVLTEFPDHRKEGALAEKTFAKWSPKPTSKIQKSVPVAGQSVPVAGQSVPLLGPTGAGNRFTVLVVGP